VLNVLRRWDASQEESGALDRMLGLADVLLDSLLDSDQDARTRIVHLIVSLPGGSTTGASFDVSRAGDLDDGDGDWDVETSNGTVYGLTIDPDVLFPYLAGALIWGGGLTVRTFTAERDTLTGLPIKTVTGYELGGAQVRRLSEAEVFAAYCTEAGTGEPLAPEQYVRYIASPALAGVADL
jgi:hypothetical protein